jgi:Skp family chaperone for outer membrane proteins
MKMVKCSIVTALVLGVVSSLSAVADVGVVDMEKLIKIHPRARADRAILEQYVKDFEDEREEMMDDLKKLGGEFETLRKEADDVSLSEKALDSKRTLARAKVEEIRQMERTMRENTATRQKELTSQELRMRKRVVADISDVVEKIAKQKKLELVLDATGVGIGGYAPVIYYADKYDITDDVIGEMPKDEE